VRNMKVDYKGVLSSATCSGHHSRNPMPVVKSTLLPCFRKHERDTLKAPMSMSISDSATGQDKWNQFVSLCSGSWNSLWSTYNWIGDMEDETIATVELLKSGDTIVHNHIIPLSSTTSSCERCQDSFETRTISVAQYSPGNLRRSSTPPKREPPRTFKTFSILMGPPQPLPSSHQLPAV
jgi:hypothetical protein